MLTEQQLAILRSAPSTNRVAKAISVAGVTQVTVADAVGLPQPYVSDVARQRYPTITVENARQFVDYFGCSIADLFPPSDRGDRRHSRRQVVSCALYRLARQHPRRSRADGRADPRRGSRDGGAVRVPHGRPVATLEGSGAGVVPHRDTGMAREQHRRHDDARVRPHGAVGTRYSKHGGRGSPMRPRNR